MSTLYISEYKNLPIGTGLDGAGQAVDGIVPCGLEPALATQTVTVGGSSTQSNAFNAATRFVRLHTDTTCSFVIGTNPTAATTSARLYANTTEFFGVTPGNGLKLAVIGNS